MQLTNRGLRRAACLALTVGSTSCSGGGAEGGGPGAIGSADAGTRVGIPCSVQAVLDAKCLRCHGEPTAFDAPYQLLTLEDFHEVHSDRPLYDRVTLVVESDYMPPTSIDVQPPVLPLTMEEKQTLLDWAGAGAPGAARVRCD